MTEIVVRIKGATSDDDTEDELRSLLRWVREDECVGDDLRGRLASSGSPVAGSMGAGFDILQFAVGSGLSLSALVVSVLQWRDGRRRAPEVTLRRGDVEIRLPADLARDEAALARFVAVLDRPATFVGRQAVATAGDHEAAPVLGQSAARAQRVLPAAPGTPPLPLQRPAVPPAEGAGDGGAA